jgi:cytochrome c oxidase accessory protein FixG
MTMNTETTSSKITDEQVEQSLFAKGQKIYPREVHGMFAGLRVLAVVGLLGLFYLLPWIMWEGHQAVLLDLPARKFYLFGLTLWPQDALYLAFLLIIAGYTLFFATTLAGRLWCGYACPQTVWTEAFLWMETLIEGSRQQQQKLDRAPMSFRKFRIKATKHTLWLVFSLHTGVTFIGFFTPIRELTEQIFAFQLGPWATFWCLFYGFATYGNAGWMREQVCKYMCPYARFQSAMFDNDTLIISYDRERGENRGSRKRSQDPKALGLGDCIDCTMCVQVCPTGIDIRNGLQYECIGCSACIDVCDDVMDKMGYEKGLIRYTTQNAMDGKPAHILRPRIIIYAVILVLLLGSLITMIATRTPLELDVIRDRNELYRETDNEMIENVYTLKLINMDDQPHSYDLVVEGIEGLQLLYDVDEIYVAAAAVLDLPIRLRVEEDSLKSRSTPIKLRLTARDDKSLTIEEEARFLGPH